MNMTGSLPLLILHALSRGASYGYAIAKQIKASSSDVLDFQEGTLLPHAPQAGEGWPGRGLYDVDQRRQRLYYRLTEAGERALEAERAAWMTYARAVNAVLGEAK